MTKTITILEISIESNISQVQENGSKLKGLESRSVLFWGFRFVQAFSHSFAQYP